MQTKQLLYCIGEREAVRRRHDADEPRPWTKDQIFHEWSFTNVRREDDRVTKWIFNNWLLPHATDVDVWFAMAVARFVNWAPTWFDRYRRSLLAILLSLLPGAAVWVAMLTGRADVLPTQSVPKSRS